MSANVDKMAHDAKHEVTLTLETEEKHGFESLWSEPSPIVGEVKAEDESFHRHDQQQEHYEGMPTDEELHTLRRVSGKVPWTAYTVAFVELVERFSFYGTTVVCTLSLPSIKALHSTDLLPVTNFIQQPLPPGSASGAGYSGQSGALGKGQQASTGISTFNQFWVYSTPLMGAYVADAYLGRFNTICVALAIAIVGHVILTASATPSLLSTNSNGALGCFLIGLVIMGIGTGGFKPNISPLVAEQVPETQLTVVRSKSGEKVIVDPAVTSSRVYMYFYFFINIGALVGQIAMVYSEKYVGFYLAYLLPTLLLCICPIVMYLCRNKYKRTPPQGSVLGKATRLFLRANQGRWSINPMTTLKNLNDGTFWENVKPSKFSDTNRPRWMTFDDNWVEEVRRGFHACSVFLWLPLYWLTYNQLNNNLTSQAAVMELNGLPNDVLSNLDPFALIILIPVCDLLIYPWLRKVGINLSPIKKIALGYFTGFAAMIWAAVIQLYM